LPRAILAGGFAVKSSHAALVVVGLSLLGLWYTADGPVAPQSTADARVSEPVSHENLTVFFVRGPDSITGAKIVTLQEALEAGLAVVHETGDVNMLAVENLSADYELFIQDGDMVRGGRQDRLIATDMLVPPRSGKVPLPAHCVESGRWTGRGNEDAKQFNKSDQFAVGNELRYANAAGRQDKVWENVKAQQDRLTENLKVKVNAPESETSLQLALENRVVQSKVAEFERVLRAAGEEHQNVVGVVFVLNGEVYGHEEYGSNELFRKAWPKLLRAAAANAVAKRPEKDEHLAHAALSTRQIERFLAHAAQAQPASDADAAGDAPFTDGVSNRVLVTNGEFGRDPRNVRQQTQELRARMRGRTERESLFTPAQDSAIMSGNGPARIDEQRLHAAQNDTNPRGNEGRGGVADVIQEVADLSPAQNRATGNRGPVPTPQPANVPGNRLNVNRVDGAAGLVTESRDPARQNAVIHKSYIKK
jgi:hypothetical protein